MAGAGTTSASDDLLNELVISIQSRFEGLYPPSNCCIFIVPERLRSTNKEAYTPRIVSIGPNHHDNPSLMPMEDHKLWYLRNFLQQNQKCHLKDYIEEVKSWEDVARNCYDKKINLDSNQFAKMMLLDGIFVIQLFRMYWIRQSMPGDPIFDKRGMLDDVCRDMALLENQMPFFAIQRLFKMAFRTHQEHMPGLLELACGFFKLVMRMEELPESEVKHFVDMIRLSFLPSVRKVPNESNKERNFNPSAMELVAAGVKLRRGESKCLLDIQFKNGVLNIPYLTLDDTTESYFRNIVAFEQCYYLDTYLTDYVLFMSRLVDTPGDAKLLIDKEIIVNWLSDKQAVAQLINTLSKEVGLSAESYYFYSLSDKLINHCQRPYNKFKRKYYSSPWAVFSVNAAGVLLFLTVVQTVCSVLSLI